MKKHLSAGFTLIELMVVMGAIAILATIVLGAINPARQWARARNRQRVNDLHQVLNAVHQYAVDNNALYPEKIKVTPQDIGAGQAALSEDLVPDYIPKLPYDPAEGNPETTRYVIFKGGGRVTATATAAELGQTITIFR